MVLASSAADGAAKVANGMAARKNVTVRPMNASPGNFDKVVAVSGGGTMAMDLSSYRGL